MARLRNVSLAQLREAVEQRTAARSDDEDVVDETTFRVAEYKALQQERREEGDHLICRPQSIDDYGPLVSEFFSHVSLVEHLAETRALTGFYRINPAAAPPSALSLGHVNWRPAFRVHGEGIFLALRSEPLKEFFASFTDGPLDAAISRASGSRFVRLPATRELVFLHTLAHLLIKRLGFEAGYGASSIRERLYSAPDGEQRMCGILLYTAAGDADGTLGGLVQLGRSGTLERTLAAALEEARWCSSDPVCQESSGQGPSSLNIAACHACALLPETSCELQNRLLDRRTVRRYFDRS